MRTSLSENTRRAYRCGWKRFLAYCDEVGVDPLAATPDDVANFIVRMASSPRSSGATTKRGEPLALSTIRVFLAAVNREYRDQQRTPPGDGPKVRSVLLGLGRLLSDPPRQVKALRNEEISQMLAHCDGLVDRQTHRMKALRDAAVLATGFAGALRRSEICALQPEDVDFVDQHGMVLHIRRSKTDQQGTGQTVAIPDGESIRPVKRMRRWVEVSGIHSGPLFQTLRRGGSLQGRAMHSSDIARLVKHYAEAIGLDPAGYSAHSLRAGFVTCAAAHHARLDKIMEVTRHRSVATVLTYIRQENAFLDHAGAAFL